MRLPSTNGRRNNLDALRQQLLQASKGKLAAHEFGGFVNQNTVFWDSRGGRAGFGITGMQRAIQRWSGIGHSCLRAKVQSAVFGLPRGVAQAQQFWASLSR
jgi:hypothetical protein